MKHIALGVNIGNLGRGQKTREPMAARCDRINRHLARKGADLRVIASYRHTGNLVLETGTLQASQAAALLSEADGGTWMAVSEDIMRGAVDELRQMPPPEPGSGVRWTPGLAFAVMQPEVVAIASSAHVRFRTMSLTTVAAWKRDRITDRGGLDSNRREGGWGAVSAAVAAQTNSPWTARSLTTLQGILQRASECSIAVSYHDIAPAIVQAFEAEEER
jgi:hypothetical protein